MEVATGFPFVGSATVTVSNESTSAQGSSVVADAMRFLYHHALPPDEVPPAPVANLTVTLDQGDLSLSWSAVTTDSAGSPETTSYYVVYRDEDPGFSPGPGDSIAGVTETSYLDPGAAGDTLTNYFYIVHAVDTSANKSSDSARVGEFDIYLETSP